MSNDSEDAVEQLKVPSRKSGIPRLVAATRYSCAGLASVWRTEEAFRVEMLVFVLMVPAALWLGGDGTERALMIAVMVLVLIAELLNTALESAVNRVGMEYHDLSRQAKDIASAAVFVSMLLVPVVWGLVLFT